MIILGKMGEGAIIMRLFKIWNIDNIFEMQIYVFTQSQSSSSGEHKFAAL